MILNKLKRYTPFILSFLSCVGVVGTAYSAVKSQKRLEDKAAEHGKVMQYTDVDGISREVLFGNEELSNADILKAYMPTILIGLGTMMCVVGTVYISNANQMSLISAYGILKESYDEYRRKNIELYGSNNHLEILNSIAAEQSYPPKINAPNLFSDGDLGADRDNYPQELFYDAYSKRYFYSTLPAILAAQYHINRNLILGAVVTVNDYYSFLGLDPTPEGNENAWYLDGDYEWIDFTNVLTCIDGKEPYTKIIMDFEPGMEWLEEY